MQSILLLCAVCASLTATAYGAGDFLIAEHPVSQEVNATGVSVTLNCTATSDGEITHWLLDGAIIDAAADSGIEVTTSGNGAGYSSTLTITSYETSRAGDYRCVARSMIDESFVEVSHGAILTHFTQRSFTTQPQDFTVYVIFNNEDPNPSHQAAAFNCEFETLPRYGRRPIILWEFESTNSGTTSVLDHSGSTQMSTFQYDHLAYFQLHRPVEGDDGSRVRCVARHPEDPSQEVTSEWANITISSASRPDDFPVFTTVMPSQLHRIEGQQLVMGCSISTPVSSVPLTWLDDDNVAFLTAGFQFIFGRPGFVPYGRTNVLVEDSAIDGVINRTYICRATLGIGEESKNITIVQAPGPLPPLSYNDVLQPFTVDYGATFNLNVGVTMADYTGRVKWFFNGLLIPSPSISPQKFTVSNNSLSLRVMNIDLNGTGLYQAELLDLEPPPFLTFQINVRGGSAFVTGGEDDIKAENGSPSVSISCPSEGSFPAVTSYVWSRNGQELTIDDSKYSVSADGNLTITNVGLNDVGTYSCTPVNALGTFNSTSTRLDVAVTISANWTADFNYPLVQGATDVTCSSLPSGLTISPEGLLSLTNPSLSLSGQYQCQLSSQYDGYMFIDLQVQGFSPDTPKIGTVEILESTGIRVNWTTPTDPLRPVNNYTLEIGTFKREKASDEEEKEDKPLQSVTNCSAIVPEGEVQTEIRTIESGKYETVITDVDFSNIYRFRIRATNVIGQSDFSGKVCFERGVVTTGEPQGRRGLAGWEIALIVIFILLLLFLCCILFLCIFLCWRREKRSYYAAKREKQDKREFEAYRTTTEPDDKS